MNIWTIANQKGGVGKTTSAVSLAGWLALAGQRTLLVDMDPHGSLTSYLGIDPESPGAGVYTLFREASEGRMADVRSTVHQTFHPHLSLMPAHTALATLDRQLGGREGMGLVLARALSRLAGQFDHVLIDCAPILGVGMVNAIAASQLVMMPTQTEYLALRGLERMLKTLGMMQRSRTSDLDYLIVPTMHDRRTRASAHSLGVLQARHGPRLWPGVIPVDTQLREASKLGQPLPMLQPDARGSVAYRELLDWLMNCDAPPTLRRAS
ncbi:MAG: ParA family protein [Halothiobacillaceae bacterium]|jgi:chromosome partitioning protein|nr:MAG: ParA family protein [Halothiobacillaceae bacterium]